jgi:glycosyltransferase involved in cell wall biosynthesis
MTAPASFRVVHAAENIKGGVGTYLRDLVVAQRASFGDGAVTVVVPRSQSDILDSPEGVDVVTFEDSGPRWRSTLRLAARMRSVMAQSDASVVHLHSTFAGLALRPMLRWAPRATPVRGAPGHWTPMHGAPVHGAKSRRRGPTPAVVYCAHGWSFDRETSSASRRLAMTLERVLAPVCDAIVCISEHEMRLARQAHIPPRMLTHISNGIPRHSPVAGIWRPEWPQDKRRLLFVGRFDRQKGVDILLEALRELRDSTFAYLVGSPVLGDGTELDLPDNVRTTGWLTGSALAACYESADLLVAPSRWEGFGLTAVEAMRAGLPVIAARVGGLAEVVEHGVTGLLVPPNSSKALVDAIRSVGTESLRSMGEAGRERFLERFTLDRMHAQLTALYQRLGTQKAAARTDASGAMRGAEQGSAPNV